MDPEEPVIIGCQDCVSEEEVEQPTTSKLDAKDTMKRFKMAMKRAQRTQKMLADIMEELAEEIFCKEHQNKKDGEKSKEHGRRQRFSSPLTSGSNRKGCGSGSRSSSSNSDSENETDFVPCHDHRQHRRQDMGCYAHFRGPPHRGPHHGGRHCHSGPFHDMCPIMGWKSNYGHDWGMRRHHGHHKQHGMKNKCHGSRPVTRTHSRGRHGERKRKDHDHHVSRSGSRSHSRGRHGEVKQKHQGRHASRTHSRERQSEMIKHHDHQRRHESPSRSHSRGRSPSRSTRHAHCGGLKKHHDNCEDDLKRSCSPTVKDQSKVSSSDGDRKRSSHCAPSRKNHRQRECQRKTSSSSSSSSNSSSCSTSEDESHMHPSCRPYWLWMANHPWAMQRRCMMGRGGGGNPWMMQRSGFNGCSAFRGMMSPPQHGGYPSFGPFFPGQARGPHFARF